MIYLHGFTAVAELKHVDQGGFRPPEKKCTTGHSLPGERFLSH